MRIIAFQSEHFDVVRCWQNENGTVMFLANDLAKGLGYRDAHNMVRLLDEDEKDTQIVSTLGGKQEMVVITESGFYHAALKARIRKAKAFRKWVTGVILPQIRKTGGFIPLCPDNSRLDFKQRTVGIARQTLVQQVQLLDSQEQVTRQVKQLLAQGDDELESRLRHACQTIDQQSRQLARQRPLVDFAEAVVSSPDSILIRDLAKLITQNGIVVGQTRLFRWLRQEGYLFLRETRPIQKWVEKGLFDIHLTLIPTRQGIKECITTKVTGKGQHYFVNGFLSGRFQLQQTSTR